jgi:hypothetical protein
VPVKSAANARFRFTLSHAQLDAFSPTLSRSDHSTEAELTPSIAMFDVCLTSLWLLQAALPQGIVPFVFAKEYSVHPDILSTA